MLRIGQGSDVNKPTCLTPCLSSPSHCPWDILSLPGNTFLCGKVWTGQEGQERTGISSLVSGYVESGLEASAALIGDHSCLLEDRPGSQSVHCLGPSLPTAETCLSTWSRPKGELANLWVPPPTEHVEDVIIPLPLGSGTSR